MTSESSDVSSLKKPESDEESLDLMKFSGTSGTTALTGVPPDSSDSAVEGHGLPKDIADGEFSGGWQPGQNAGSWVGRTSPLTEQAQVLVANVYLPMCWQLWLKLSVAGGRNPGR